MLSVLAVTAVSTGGGQDTLQWALDQGGAFLVAVVCAVGWWLAEKRVAKAEARADAERASRDVLADSFMVKVIPAQEASTAAVREFLEVVRQRRWPDQHG